MKRVLSVLLVLGLLIGCLAACSASGDTAARSNKEGSYSDALLGETAEETSAEAESPLTAGRKIIRDAQLTVETKAFDDALSALNKQIEAVGGYIESSETDGDSTSYRDATVVARIPADKLDTFLDAADGLGNVTYKTTSAYDVTDSYVDVESRIAALTAEKEALTELLKNAGSLSDILSIRDRLADVTANLESYQARLNAMDSQIAYSTVTISVYEVELITAAEGGFWEEVSTRFLNNLARLGKALRSFAVWFLGASPWFICLAVIAVVVVLIVRANVRRRRRRRAKQLAQMQQKAQQEQAQQQQQ